MNWVSENESEVPYVSSPAYKLYSEYQKYRKSLGGQDNPKQVDLVIGDEYYLYESADRHTARNNQVTELIVKHCLELSGKRPVIVEVGAGLGNFAEKVRESLAQVGIRTVDYRPIDVVLNSLKRQKEKGLNSIMATATTLPFENESADVVYAGEVIEHLPYEMCIQFLKEMRRVLKRGGRLVLTTPNYHSVPAERDINAGLQPLTFDPERDPYAEEHQFPFTKETMVDLLQRIGFQVKKISTNEIVTRMDGEKVVESKIFYSLNEVPTEEKDVSLSKKFLGSSIIVEAEK